jgi:hypothetical protein
LIPQSAPVFDFNMLGLNQNPSIPFTQPQPQPQPQTEFHNFTMPQNGFNSQSDTAMKQIFKNNEVTFYASLSGSNDRTQVNGSFYISNNVDKHLSNVKFNLLVKKHITCKVVSASGTSLEPKASLGVKKVIIIFYSNLFRK